ncbi:lipoprotein, putative [Rhodobacterales bacterium HTCC2150]|nr:lipoprotein, putative [Rhodobacterales bacterium HTCC2150] [Rhodobacteraceae bacterium HTCC2150]
MIGFRLITAAVVFGALSACSSSDLVTRNSAADPIALQLPTTSWSVADVNVTVPRNLLTTEADMYYPRADLVWHGDPVGDRYVQVEELMDRGLTAGVANLNGTRPVNFEVTVRRFHGVTPKAANTVGGVHDMVFDLAVVDAGTGVILAPAQTYQVDVKAYGGNRALKAARAGFTQKYRIMAGLQDWAQTEFGVSKSTPEVPNGYVALN